MTEPERIKNIEEQITLAELLPGVNLEWFPPEESEKLKRAVLDIYRLSHARGFKAGADHAINAVSSALRPRSDDAHIRWIKRRLSARVRGYWQDYKKSLRSIRASVIRKFSEE
jgi:hypothetical protein